MRRRRAWLWSLLVCCVLTGAGCSWLQDEFFSLDRAAPEPEPPAPGTQPRW